ncbi:sortase [Candidatus Roizmanbacteria bacterium]|nr:MAG: sortase [Candidatus Roizmanbacteria bacterium]
MNINGNTVTVIKIGDGPACQDISHLEGTYGLSGPSATPTPTHTPTDTPIPSNTPTNTPEPSPTYTPTPIRETPTPTPTKDEEEGPSPTPTNTPTPEEEEGNTPTPTKTPAPTNTPTQGPTNTPGPGPTNTPGPSPTNTPGPTNTPAPETSNPVVQGVTRTSTAQILSAEDNFNPIVLGLKRSFGGQVLGASTFPKTGAEDSVEEKLPSGNVEIENTTLTIPAIGVNRPVYQGGKLGDMLVVGDKEILKAEDFQNVYYGHNTPETLGAISYLSYGDSIIVQEKGSVSVYKVTYKQYINGYAEMDRYVNDNKLTLISCALQNQDIRVIITAEKVN